MQAKPGILIVLLAVAAPAWATPVAGQAGPKQPAPAPTVLDEGRATWYGGWHKGRRTLSGEIFDPSKMTAAHTSLPMGTVVRVTDNATGRSVVVRINDREPPHGVRCIDLSEQAARNLGMHDRGVADVTITAVNPDDAVELADASVPPHRVVSARRGPPHRRHAAQ
jgi:rare lipoprotein A